MKSDSQRFGWGSQVNKVPVHYPGGDDKELSILSDFKELDVNIVHQFGLYRYLSDTAAKAHIRNKTIWINVKNFLQPPIMLTKINFTPKSVRI